MGQFADGADDVTTEWKPTGYNSVSPYLIVPDAEALLAFLQAAFGATPLRRYDTPDGSIMHAEARVGDSVVMFAQATTEWPPVPQHIHVYVPDVDATWRRALAAGGVAVKEPTQREGDPDRRGGVMDPGGNSWWVSTQSPS